MRPSTCNLGVSCKYFSPNKKGGSVDCGSLIRALCRRNARLLRRWEALRPTMDISETLSVLPQRAASVFQLQYKVRKDTVPLQAWCFVWRGNVSVSFLDIPCMW